GGAHVAPPGARRDRLRTRAGDSAMEPAAPRDDLPQARAASDGEELPLDLFTPDDGHFEYYAVATNMALGLPALFAFVCGRGAQEKTLAELKGEFALDVVPTNHYGANSAWQQLSVLAYNLARNFQLDTLAELNP